MREKGVNHALLEHSMSNIGSFAVGSLLFKIFPKKQAEDIATKIAILREQPKPQP